MQDLRLTYPQTWLAGRTYVKTQGETGADFPQRPYLEALRDTAKSMLAEKKPRMGAVSAGDVVRWALNTFQSDLESGSYEVFDADELRRVESAVENSNPTPEGRFALLFHAAHNFVFEHNRDLDTYGDELGVWSGADWLAKLTAPEVALVCIICLADEALAIKETAHVV